MKLPALALAAGIAAAPSAQGTEANTPVLKLKAKVLSVASYRAAPFLNPSAEPDLGLVPRPEDGRRESRWSSCSGDRSLCYDSASGRIVYKPARQLMPEIRGLTRENLSIKRDRIVLRYSFK
jgi:hypothetical protein